MGNWPCGNFLGNLNAPGGGRYRWLSGVDGLRWIKGNAVEKRDIQTGFVDYDAQTGEHSLD